MPADRNVSIEREVWPRLIGDGLYGFPAESYWLDIGTPERYLQGTFDIIEGNVKHGRRRAPGRRLRWRSTTARRSSGRVIPPAVIERGVTVAEGAQVGSLVVLGEDVSVGAGATVERSVILNGAEIGEGCDAARLHRRRRMSHRRAHAASSGGAVLGEGVTVGADNVIAARGAYLPWCDLARRRDQVLIEEASSR